MTVCVFFYVVFRIFGARPGVGDFVFFSYFRALRGFLVLYQDRRIANFRLETISFCNSFLAPREVFKSQKMIAMLFLNASVLERKALNRNLSWGIPLGNLLPKTRVLKHRVLERKRRPNANASVLGTQRFRTLSSGPPGPSGPKITKRSQGGLFAVSAKMSAKQKNRKSKNCLQNRHRI